MEIKKCCKQMRDGNHNIFLSDGEEWDGLPKGTPFYWTGENVYVTEIAIKYCPFCGKKIEVIK